MVVKSQPSSHQRLKFGTPEAIPSIRLIVRTGTARPMRRRDVPKVKQFAAELA